MVASVEPVSDPKAAAVLQVAKARFLERNPKSLHIHQDASRSMPGGNTRTVLHTAPFPVSMAHGHGYQVFSEDGHTYAHHFHHHHHHHHHHPYLFPNSNHPPTYPPFEKPALLIPKSYTDFVGEFTAALYGHSHPTLLAAITSTLQQTGLNLGAQTRAEAALAQRICARFGLARLRFCNSGTEANLHALGAARAFTKRRRVVVFRGGYHGGVLSFAHGVAANNVDVDDWVVAPYNDAAGARKAILDEGGRGGGVAAVLVEAMQGAGGCIPATKEFLLAVRGAAREVGAVFVLDEVMTSRMGRRGLQGAVDGLDPDLITFGKWLGGGLAFGAFGGREDVMAVFDPTREGALAQSGTFNNNSLAMRAGLVGMTEVFTEEVADKFKEVGEAFLRTLRDVTVGTKATFTGVGTVISLHITDAGVRDIVRIDEVEERADLMDIFWMEMMEEGFWITRRGMIALILGTPKSELDRFVESVKAFLERHKDLMAL